MCPYIIFFPGVQVIGVDTLFYPFAPDMRKPVDTGQSREIAFGYHGKYYITVLRYAMYLMCEVNLHSVCYLWGVKYRKTIKK